MMQELVRRLGNLAYDVTVGLIKEYKRTTIDLAKIEMAAFYVKVIKVVRQEILIAILIVLGAIMFANVIAVLQMAVLLYAPWGTAAKIAAALLLGVVAVGAPLAAALVFFSQRRWMEVTKADEMLERAVGSTAGSPEAGRNGSA